MKRIQKIFLISILISLVIISVAAVLILKGTSENVDPNQVIEQFFENSKEAPIITILVMLLITAAVLVPFMKIIFPPTIRNGEKAKATIDRFWDTGTTINDDPQVGMQVSFVTREGLRCQAETKTLVSRLQVALLQPGMSAEIVYDPSRPTRVQILNLAIEAQNTGSAEERLAELARLKEKGLINDAEYQRKREEIIRSI